MRIERWSFVKIHPHGGLHFTEDAKRTHCGLGLRENSATVERPDLSATYNCAPCMRWANIYDEQLREEYGDIEAAREAMKHVSH